MVEPPFPPDDPPAQPPPGTREPVTWHLAHRMFREHVRRGDAGTRCVSCGEPWPCGGRRLGERGLYTAYGDGPGAPPAPPSPDPAPPAPPAPAALPPPAPP